MSRNYFSEETTFFGNTNPEELAKIYGTPLYVYNEDILIKRCDEMKSVTNYENFVVDYSIKANSNLNLLRIIHKQGLEADAMSPGEIHVLLAAGFTPDQILYVSNNVSVSEMKFAVDKDIIVSLDSLSQLELFGKNFPGARAAIRFNTGYGAGHHEKVITAGKKTKFGINDDRIDDVIDICEKYSMRIVGINQHIGSLFLEETAYVTSAELICNLASRFKDLKFVDLGGGFGIPYMKQEGQRRLNLVPLNQKLTTVMNEAAQRLGKKIQFRTEPGRYIVAECCILLGRVHATKDHAGIDYVGTDIGMNVLQRPILYDSHHDIEVYDNGKLVKTGMEAVTIVGNICESGDKLVIGRTLPKITEGNLIGVMDAGAYGYSMASNYNNRLKPAEVLISGDGSHKLIRRRDTLESLMSTFNLD